MLVEARANPWHLFWRRKQPCGRDGILVEVDDNLVSLLTDPKLKDDGAEIKEICNN